MAAQSAANPSPAPDPALAKLRTVYDLVGNRAHAVEYDNGRLVMRAGGPEFLKFIDGGWKTSWILGLKDEGRAVALVSGLSGILFFPVDQQSEGVLAESAAPAGDGGAGNPGDRRLTISLRSLIAGQRLSVFVNEQAAGTVEVPTTFGDVSFTVPGKLLVPGENRLRLMFRAAAPIAGGRRSAAAVAQIAIGAPGSVLVAARSASTVETRAGSAPRRGFVVPPAGRLSFFVQVPTAGKLVTGYGPADVGATGASIVARITRDGAVPRILFEGPASVAAEAAWDLGPEAGHAARIDFVSRGGASLWASPRLAIAEPKLPAVAEKRFDNIFIWMVDTLRADKVRAFNPKTRVETPNYDAFAADATRFAWAQVPGTWSLPSHSSILTGVYPSVHKATAHTARLSREIPFIAELMKKGGYHTGLFSSNGYVSGKWGFDRGWDINRNFIRENLPNGAEYLWKTARQWIDAPANRNKPKFLYLATVEPHVIYNPRKEFLARYWKKPYTGPIKPNQSGIQLGLIKSGKLKITDNDKAYLEALHDAEITQSDAAFGAFLADLKERKIYDSSAIVVISDHGDEFWEHGDVGHAQGVYQELVHIPLIVRAPGVLPAGRVVDADVEAMDVFPTLLELAGLPIPATTQGMSLLPLIADEASLSPRVSLTQNLDINRGIKSGRYRLVHPGLGRAEIYDEIDDPLEKKNLVTTHHVAHRHMRNVFSVLYANENQWRKRTWGTAANLLEPFYAEALR